MTLASLQGISILFALIMAIWFGLYPRAMDAAGKTADDPDTDRLPPPRPANDTETTP